MYSIDTLPPPDLARGGSSPVPSPRCRPGATTSFTVGGAYGHLLTSTLADGTLADVRIMMAKEGSTMRGLTDGLSAMLTIGLRHGVPLETLLSPLIGTRFEPLGTTDDPEIPEASSITDYVARRLAFDYLPASDQPGRARESAHATGVVSR
ncbi:hypothetical protein R8Z50_22440 [Longispora sp. K20-0274]|uniref:TSCPD domain-containing protein n=1 Tax=Longispora sp. K20-0274 TaxID=3088255 RepID=UPI00399A3F32